MQKLFRTDKKMGNLRLVLYAFVVVIAGTTLYFTILNRLSETPPIPSSMQHFQTAASKDQIKTETHLYFADKEKPYLIAEQRGLLHANNPVSFGNVILTALAGGPRKELMPTFPMGTSFRTFFIDQKKTAYVDLNGSIREKHPGGTLAEILTIYSLVNSLVLNIKEIDTVKILIDGRETMTLCGHFDTRLPLKANMLLVR